LNWRLEFPEPAAARFLEQRASYPWMVVGTVCIGAFTGQVDASIVQLAMPTLEDAFDAPLNAVSWVAIGDMLAFAATLPDIRSSRRDRRAQDALPLGLRTLRAFLGALRPRSKPTDPHHLAPTPGRKRGDAWRKQPRCPCGGRRPGAKGEKPLWPHHFAVTYSNSFERMIELSSQDWQA
jgi:hypothetical protein